MRDVTVLWGPDHVKLAVRLMARAYEVSTLDGICWVYASLAAVEYLAGTLDVHYKVSESDTLPGHCLS